MSLVHLAREGWVLAKVGQHRGGEPDREENFQNRGTTGTQIPKVTIRQVAGRALIVMNQ